LFGGVSSRRHDTNRLGTRVVRPHHIDIRIDPHARDALHCYACGLGASSNAFNRTHECLCLELTPQFGIWPRSGREPNDCDEKQR